MEKRRYYSQRKKNTSGKSFDNLETLRKLFIVVSDDFADKGYFAKSFGYICEDAGHVVGTLGGKIKDKILLILRKSDLWPFLPPFTFIEDKDARQFFSEEDVFDVIELLFDNAAKPREAYYHSWNACGNHYSDFDVDLGKIEWRDEINQLLRDYKSGYELNEQGEIVTLFYEELDTLAETALPSQDPENIENKVYRAIEKFRSRHSSIQDRKDSIRELADVCEFLKKQAQPTLNRKDEQVLFEIANNFGIRHHDGKQMTNYDPSIWLSWMFHFYLATIHAWLRLIKRPK